jgi:hypothetical protein
MCGGEWGGLYPQIMIHWPILSGPSNMGYKLTMLIRFVIIFFFFLVIKKEKIKNQIHDIFFLNSVVARILFLKVNKLKY